MTEAALSTRTPADEAAVSLLRRAIAVPSVTGDERAFARLVAEELEASAADEVRVLDTDTGRPLVWSRTGDGDGPSVLFCGHLDVVRAVGYKARWGDDPRADPFRAVEAEGHVWGRGASDVKGGICAVLSALHRLRREERRPQGTVFTAWIPDEESGEPGTGRSLGMTSLCERIERGDLRRPDVAIYVEPTSLAVYCAQIGFLIAEVEIVGRAAYFARPAEGVDALRAAHAVLAALWRRADELGRQDAHPLLGRPALVVYAAEAGGTIAVPGSTTLSVIRTLLPGEDLDTAAREIETMVAGAVSGTGCAATVAFPAGRDHRVGGLAAELDPEDPLVEGLRDALGGVLGSRPPVAGAPFWSEMSFLTQRLGIPCVYAAAGDIATCHTPEERVPIQEYLDARDGFAHFIAQHCGLVPHRRPLDGQIAREAQ